MRRGSVAVVSHRLPRRQRCVPSSSPLLPEDCEPDGGFWDGRSGRADPMTHRNLALVTGASSGIGLELARQFATHDFDVVVTAEDAELTTAAGALRESGATVHEVRTDLRTSDGVEHLWREVSALGRPLDAAALNAGVGRGGAFLDIDLADELDIIDLNITSTVHLAKLVLRDMTARGAGLLLITSSIASTMPGSFQAVYNASKSF